ncbi:VIR protein [Plasmodium vivax]|uniref:VIR protein n=1 Tax=Plasmodium vivax TaxID=5855 RepID=A0A1G4ECW8_PLAVI|nr:VIR protein [Plasmodium vivax]
MAKTSIDNLILDYRDYSTITKIFKEKNDYEYSEKYDVVLKYGNVDEWKIQKYNKTYEELYKHLRNDGVMLSYTEQACKYISYFIHKELKDVRNHYYNSDSFNIFLKYVNDYFGNRRISNARQNCLPHIVYVDENMYEQLDRIYRLYNLYAKVLSSNIDWTTDKCLYFKSFVSAYNDYMENHKPTCLKLNEILNHFKGYVTNSIEDFKGKKKCSAYDYTLTPIDPYVNPEEVKLKDKTELEERSIQTLQQQVTEPQKKRMEEENHLKLPPTDHGQQEAKITRPHEGINQAVKAEDTPVRKEVANTEFHSPDLYDDIIPRALARKETKEQSLYPQYELERDQGTMGKITGAISGFIKDVDPGPVLGVSGGMGVLFILFKYTPVGSFFGGRRGRIRQIPSGFHGHFLGAFPDIQDYGGGYVGYSPMDIPHLAE